MPFKGSSARRGSISLCSQDPRFSVIDGAMKIERNVLETQIVDQANIEINVQSDNLDNEPIIDDIKNYKPFDKEVYDRISRRCSMDVHARNSISGGAIDVQALLAGIADANKKFETESDDSWTEKPEKNNLNLDGLGQSLGLSHILNDSSDLLQSLDIIEAKIALDKCRLNICQATRAPIDAEFKIETAKRYDIDQKKEEDETNAKFRFEMVVRVENCTGKSLGKFKVCVLEQKGRPQYKVCQCELV